MMAADVSSAVLRVLIVDDHEVVRSGLSALLANSGDIEIIDAVGSATEAIRSVTEKDPDVAIVDLRLPDLSGDELTRRLIRQKPELSIIILSTFDSESAIRASFEAGAVGYVSKSAGLQPLREYLAKLHRGEKLVQASASEISDALQKRGRSRANAHHPTPQQTRVLELAAQGLTNKEVGSRLYISESTVRFHLQKLKELTSSRTRTELIAKAIRTGMLASFEESSPDGRTQ